MQKHVVSDGGSKRAATSGISEIAIFDHDMSTKTNLEQRPWRVHLGCVWKKLMIPNWCLEMHHVMILIHCHSCFFKDPIWVEMVTTCIWSIFQTELASVNLSISNPCVCRWGSDCTFTSDSCAVLGAVLGCPTLTVGLPLDANWRYLGFIPLL